MFLCRICIIFFALLVQWHCTLVSAAETEQAVLQKIVTDAADKYTKAMLDRDPRAVSALFTPEAEYVDSDGVVFHGREAIEAEYAAHFQVSPPGTVMIELVSIRPVAAGVMIEEGVATFTPKDPGPSARTRYTATHVKQADGNWLMASVRELEAPAVTTHDRLGDLAWLQGKWHEDSDGEVVDTEWKWSQDGNFLLSKFSVKGVEDLTLDGTHRIGWDAERKQFRSWVFDSKGGFAEGFWTHEEDDSWSVYLSGVDPDGARLSARLTYTRDGADALVISEDQRSQAGVGLPGFSRRIVREPPVPQKPDSAKPGSAKPALKR